MNEPSFYKVNFTGWTWSGSCVQCVLPEIPRVGDMVAPWKYETPPREFPPLKVVGRKLMPAGVWIIYLATEDDLKSDTVMRYYAQHATD